LRAVPVEKLQLFPDTVLLGSTGKYAGGSSGFLRASGSGLTGEQGVHP